VSVKRVVRRAGQRVKQQEAQAMKSTVSGSAPLVVACVAAAASFIATGPTARAADAQQPVTRVATKRSISAALIGGTSRLP